MNSIIGYLRSDGPSAASIDGVLGEGASVEHLGRGSVAVRGSLGSVAVGETWVCGVSGRIDNLDALAGQPDQTAVEARTIANVVGTLFAKSGPDVLREIRGIFAGVFTDGDRLWWFRDQMGFWPLFQTSFDGQFVAADSIRACISVTGRAYEVNSAYLEDFFYGRIGSSSATAVRGVHRIHAASWARVGVEPSATRQYWNPKELVELDPPEEAEVPEMFSALMTQAVDRMLTGADALSLSGGIDSPVLAAFAAPRFRVRFGQALPAVSAVYPDVPAVDEEDLTRLVANDLGMPLHTYRPTAKATDDLSKWVSLLDGPVPVVSVAETRETLSVARSLGAGNLITGEWAEYLFDMPQRTLAYLIRRGRWRAAGGYWASLRRRDVSTSTILTRLAKDLAPFSLRRTRALQLMGASTPAWIERNRLVFHPRGPVTEEWRSNQAGMTSGPSLGLEADHVVQMEAGMSIRRPFADVDLVEFFVRLPAEVKYPGPGHKPLIRSLMRGRVPSSILDRTDKTLFDEAVMAGIDFESLNSYLADDEIISGVDYRSLRKRLANRRMDLVEYMWAKDLAAVHAFVAHAGSQ
jgi:asparagine synthase (glutamine-hydrolysing)